MNLKVRYQKRRSLELNASLSSRKDWGLTIWTKWNEILILGGANGGNESYKFDTKKNEIKIIDKKL